MQVGDDQRASEGGDLCAPCQQHALHPLLWIKIH